MTRMEFTPRTYERYPRPSFGDGFARALDLFGNGYRSPLSSKPGSEVDAEAIALRSAATSAKLWSAQARVKS